MTITKQKLKDLEKKCNQIRCDVLTMLNRAASGHTGGSLSCIELVVALYYEVMRHNPKVPDWPEKDRFHLSKGHAAPTWYAVLADCGYFSKEELKNLRCLGSILQGHPDMTRTPGVEMTSGSLGQGLSIAVGMALAGKLNRRDSRVYVLLGDGELQEGQIWEAAMSAGHYKLDKLCALIDCNKLQIDGKVAEIIDIEPLREKWRAFNWEVFEVDGHNLEEIIEACNEAGKVKGKPAVIIAHTVKGKGVCFMEHVVDFHGVAPTDEECTRALEELKKKKG